MNIRKDLGRTASETPGPEELERINCFAKTPLTAEQVYCFALRLCDNEVDRDGERFPAEALAALGELFVGKSGIFDHQWTAEGQTARIYRTELVHEPGVQTAMGDESCWLKAWAYLLRTEKNADLIAEIEGGIKKEVSIGCSVARRACSICGAEPGSCQHVPGERYGGKLCCVELREPTDAYEWSFVAVPAQRKAGVVKRMGCSAERDRIEKEAALGRRYLKELRREVVRLALATDERLNGEVFWGIAQKLEEPELLELKRVYGARAEAMYPLPVQLRRNLPDCREDESVFLV